MGLYHYTVRGSGPFPLDLLRVNHSWPRDNVYASLSQDERAPERYVLLATPWKPRSPDTQTWMRHGWAIAESNKVR